eukprot:Phypoly_transcript_07304.p1 GENE.Phypoly_transcript_07304~~Phypoly_transcript_07304.p1  ORF type:complete len:452 (+),score=66.59 Phypoly_transcript_07304:101-1357(+)
MNISNSGTGTALAYVQYATGSIPGSFIYDPNTLLVRHNDFAVWHNVCPQSTPAQYYFVVYATDAAEITVTFSIVNVKFEIGTPTTVTLLPPAGYSYSFNAFVATLPSNCASAYKVEISDPDMSAVVTTDLICVDSKSSLSTVYQHAVNLRSEYGIISTPDCGAQLTVAFSSVPIASTVTITVTPATPCPQDCNSVGTCLDGGNCLCDYPYYGSGCSYYDKQCYAPSDLPFPSVCASSSSFEYRYIHNGALEYCDVMDTGHELVDYVAQFQASLTQDGIQLSTECHNELVQIICDSSFSPCINSPNGLQFGIPCNGLTYMSRCVPSSYTGSFDVAADFDLSDYTTPYVCNTNTSAPTSAPSSSTSSPTATPLPTSSTSPSSTSPSSTSSPTPTPAPISAGYKLRVCHYVAIVLILVVAM